MSVTVSVPKSLRLGYERTLKLLKRVGGGDGEGGGGLAGVALLSARIKQKKF